MTGSHTKRARESIPADKLMVHFPEGLKQAFGELADAVKGRIETEMYLIARDWGNGEPVDLYEFAMALPMIGDEVSAHVRANGDKRVEKAWGAVKHEIAERSFTVEKSKVRGGRGAHE
jgi:hypothetical protein